MRLSPASEYDIRKAALALASVIISIGFMLLWTASAMCPPDQRARPPMDAGPACEGGVPRTLEWIWLDDACEAIARVVRVQGPLCTGWRRFQAVALDADAKVVELRPAEPPDGARVAGLRRRPGGRAGRGAAGGGASPWRRRWTVGSDLSPRSCSTREMSRQTIRRFLTGSVRISAAAFQALSLNLTPMLSRGLCAQLKPVDFQPIMELARNLRLYKIVSCATA